MRHQTLKSLLPEVDESVLSRALLNPNFKSAVADLQTAMTELDKPDQDAWSQEHWTQTKNELLDELRRRAQTVEQTPNVTP